MAWKLDKVDDDSHHIVKTILSISEGVAQVPWEKKNENAEWCASADASCGDGCEELIVTPGDRRVFLGTIAGGSAFTRAGLQSGDEVGSINGKSVDTMTEAEIRAAFRNKNVQVVVWRNDGKDMVSTAIQTPRWP
jgi:S1-C subfamily serine protease